MLTALRTNQSRRSCCRIDGKLRFHCVPNVTFPKTDLRVWADLGSDAGAAEVGAVGDWTPRCNFLWTSDHVDRSQVTGQSADFLVAFGGLAEKTERSSLVVRLEIKKRGVGQVHRDTLAGNDEARERSVYFPDMTF